TGAPASAPDIGRPCAQVVLAGLRGRPRLPLSHRIVPGHHDGGRTLCQRCPHHPGGPSRNGTNGQSTDLTLRLTLGAVLEQIGHTARSVKWRDIDGNTFRVAVRYAGRRGAG